MDGRWNSIYAIETFQLETRGNHVQWIRMGETPIGWKMPKNLGDGNGRIGRTVRGCCGQHVTVELVEDIPVNKGDSEALNETRRLPKP
jgi:hypothetical protein